MIVEEVPDFELPKPVAEEPEPPIDINPVDDLSGENIELPATTFKNVDDLPKPPEADKYTVHDYVPFDEEPVLITFVRPQYPDLAREAGIEGVVMVRVRINESGKVVAACVLLSDVTESMNQSALAAALQCRFEPAKQQDRAVPVDVVIPFEFRLESR